jgi:hypothetical protein
MSSNQSLKPARELAEHNRRFPGESEQYRRARTAAKDKEINSCC